MAKRLSRGRKTLRRKTMRRKNTLRRKTMRRKTMRRKSFKKMRGGINLFGKGCYDFKDKIVRKDDRTKDYVEIAAYNNKSTYYEIRIEIGDNIFQTHMTFSKVKKMFKKFSKALIAKFGEDIKEEHLGIRFPYGAIRVLKEGRNTFFRINEERCVRRLSKLNLMIGKFEDALNTYIKNNPGEGNTQKIFLSLEESGWKRDEGLV